MTAALGFARPPQEPYGPAELHSAVAALSPATQDITWAGRLRLPPLPWLPGRW